MRQLIAAAFIATCALISAGHTQDYPTRPVTMVVPFAAGGPTDVLARVVADRMGQLLGQQVVVENIGGAGGMTGAQRVAQAPPDGYTIGLGTVGTHAQNQTLYKRPLYNAATDFTPVALLAQVPLVLISRKDLPANNLQEFIAYLKANQDKISYGSAGAGSATHLGCALLNAAIGVTVQHVPYRGTGPAMQDLAAGRIDYLCEIVTTALPQIQGGTVKPIAMLSLQRSPVLPNLRDRQRKRAAELRSLHLERDLPAQGRRGSDRQEAARRCRGNDEDAGREGAAGKPGRDHRPGRQDDAGVSRQVRQKRNREMGRADPRQRRGDRVDRGFPQRERLGCPAWMRKLPRGGDLSPVSVSIGKTLIGRDFCHPSRPWLSNFMGDVGCGRLACADPLRRARTSCTVSRSAGTSVTGTRAHFVAETA